MKTKFAVLTTLLLITFVCGCTQSDVSNIEKLTPQINDHLTEGDKYFNQSARALNDFKMNSTIEKCDRASSEYNSARSLTSEALSYAQSSKENVYIQYLQLVISEIDAKLNGTSELRTAAQLFNDGENETANEKVSNANQIMLDAKNFETQRQTLVKQNPDKFK
ncbi:hypothetical protein [Methanobacterium alcaliphilum]|uniref:hypothetical protein n=1 Tax=Methanobacterium alcaliphilum TaxID=392018 RepID=UPI00200A9C3A|nr:hypothetical protein [Methanobacterium alcaliphilum]MCK9150814.1 hypothetical protein [Methanobacterium alcaliphilum]